jgi:hypothetical protein
MQRAMARQAEAERERRAKVIHAVGEYQASERLRDAADIIRVGFPAPSSSPIAAPAESRLEQGFPLNRGDRI